MSKLDRTIGIPAEDSGWCFYYLHENGSLIHRPKTYSVESLEESDFVQVYWRVELSPNGATKFLIAAARRGAASVEIERLAKSWGLRASNFTPYLPTSPIATKGAATPEAFTQPTEQEREQMKARSNRKGQSTAAVEVEINHDAKPPSLHSRPKKVMGIIGNVPLMGSFTCQNFATAEEKVYIYDPVRQMYWKHGQRGYTPDWQDAGLFPVSVAQDIVKGPNVKDYVVPQSDLHTHNKPTL